MVGIFLIVWGIVFAGIPVYSYVSSSQSGVPAIPLFVVVIFGIIGIVAFSLGIYNIFFFFKRKLIAKTGSETVATFLDMQVGDTKNGTKMYFLKFFFTDENNVRHEKMSAVLFTFQQAYYFKTLYHFKIRYRGKLAIITEPLNFEKLARLPKTEQESFLNYSSQHNVRSLEQAKDFKKIVPRILSTGTATYLNKNEGSFSKPYNEKQFFTCDYCGYVQDVPGRCLSCGARIKPKK